MDPASAELPAKTPVVAIDPGKAKHRVLSTDGERALIGNLSRCRPCPTGSSGSAS